MKTIYLDYCATTPIAPEVQQSIIEMLPRFGNPASAHPFGWFAAEKVQIAREQVAAAIGADTDEIVFTSGATEANNLALQGIARRFPGAQILSAATEHRAVLDPLTTIADNGHQVKYLGVDTLGRINLTELAEAFRPETKLVSLMLANNEIGTIHPIADIAQLCKSQGVLLHCDATQSLGRMPVDVSRLGIDLLSISAHKCYGPKGVGALYIRRGTELSALIEGGGHESGFRSGTLNTLGIVGFGTAAELARSQHPSDAARMQELSSYFMTRLSSEIGGIDRNGDQENCLPGLLNFSIAGISNVRLLSKLQTKVAFSLASACQSTQKDPSHVLKAIGLPRERAGSVVRLSLGRYTTKEELDQAHIFLTAAVLSLRHGDRR